MLDKERNKGEQCLHFDISQWKVKSRLDILNNISENSTIVQLVNTDGNINNTVIIVGYYIFDSNDKKALPSKTDSFNIIFSPSER